MPPDMKPRISAREGELLAGLIQYLNLEEMRTFCRTHRLPLFIHVETPAGGLRRTGDRDRKDVVLARMLDLAQNDTRSGPTMPNALPGQTVSFKTMMERGRKMEFSIGGPQ